MRFRQSSASSHEKVQRRSARELQVCQRRVPDAALARHGVVVDIPQVVDALSGVCPRQLPVHRGEDAAEFGLSDFNYSPPSFEIFECGKYNYVALPGGRRAPRFRRRRLPHHPVAISGATTGSENARRPTFRPERTAQSSNGLSCANSVLSVSADADAGFPGCGEGEVLLLGGPAREVRIRACGAWTRIDGRTRASFRLQLEIPIKVGSPVQPSMYIVNQLGLSTSGLQGVYNLDSIRACGLNSRKSSTRL
ncbi:hypothetical protein GGX14DRAFT_396414 [Mycena pura]|uniref:Uncharacterized protein n=1 Tax=Mycena pura TaxID=153505 RepID=A0AAD6VEL7_9AGAR|nr:hypothetical protein GGX14DRAFT_396414 [Mycena pura]